MKFTAFCSAVFVCFSYIAEEPKSIVKEFVIAFNEKNVAAMQGYFQSVPSTQSEIVNMFTNQNFVSTVDKAT